MIEELFRCVVYDLVRSRFSRELAHWEFRFAVQCVMYSNERWRLPFHAESLARKADPDNILKVRIGQIADLRDKWLNPGLGFFIRCDYHGDEGLEITAQFRRDRRKAEEAPRQQMELAIPPAIVGLPQPLPAPANSGLRVRRDSDSEKEILTDSRPPSPFPPTAGFPTPSGLNASRVNRQGDGEGRKESPPRDYTRTLNDIRALPHGQRLYDFIGMKQMAEELRASGAEWLRILRDEAAELAELLEQGERSRAAMPSGKTRAMFLTARLFERRRSAKSSDPREGVRA